MDTGAMITCPKCGNKLPEWAQVCQFCKADVRQVARPAPAKKKEYHFASLEPPKWVMPAYFISIVVMLLLNAWSGFADYADMQAGKGWCLTPVTMGISFAVCLVCLLALLRIEIFRGMLNIVCGYDILVGLKDAGIAFAFMMGVPALGLLLLVLALMKIGFAGFLIFLIGETDKYAPS